MKPANVVLVSAYGRGHWLAVSLLKKGLNPLILDVTERLGSWSPEKAEGPFGFFNTENFDSSQYERLSEDDQFIDTPHGFTLWLSSGPLEFKGPTVQTRLKKLGDNLKLIDSLAHGWNLNEYIPSVENLHKGQKSPFLSKFMVRFPSRQGHQKSIDWCRRMGVHTLQNASILDISLKDRKTVRGIEYKADRSEKSEIAGLDQLIWSLSSEETGMLSTKIQQTLFPNGALEPEWYWARYRLKISEGSIRDSIPLHSLVVKDLDQPWTHENFVILIRTGSSDLFDAWMRLPHVQRFNKDYLTQRGQSLLSMFQEKLVSLTVELSEFPAGAEGTYQQIGPVRWGLYSSEQKKKWKPGQFKNVGFDIPELRDQLGINYQFQQQSIILKEIELWWNKLLSKQKTKESSL